MLVLCFFFSGDCLTAGDLGILTFVNGDLKGDNFRLVDIGFALNSDTMPISVWYLKLGEQTTSAASVMTVL